MRTKNYYKTLGVDTGATREEIRKAYRQLALKYHPDKNNGDEVSALHFKEIHEAYQTLSDPQRRSAYNQKTWYHKHGLHKHAQPLTAYLVFTKTNELKLFLEKLRPSSINKQALARYIKHLLSADSIRTLKQANDATINKEIITNLLKATEALSASDTHSIAVRLRSIADADSMSLINQKIKQIQVQRIWERYQFLIIVILTIIICIMIYFLSA